MKIDGRNQPHGTPAHYYWCKQRPEGSCDDCRRAATRRKNERELAKSRGERFFLPVGEATAHITALREAGMGIKAIAVAAVMSTSTVMLLITGEKDRVGVDLNRRILAIEPRPLRLRPAASKLRFQALQAAGYTRVSVAEKMAPHLGGRVSNLRVRGEISFVTRPVAEALVAVCREIGLTQGPSEITRLRSLKRGFRPPADFDEEQFLDIDWDGAEDELVQERRDDAILEDVELIEKFLKEPSNDQERAWNRALVEERIGVTYGYVNTLRQRRASREWKARRDAA